MFLSQRAADGISKKLSVIIGCDHHRDGTVPNQARCGCLAFELLRGRQRGHASQLPLCPIPQGDFQAGSIFALFPTLLQDRSEVRTATALRLKRWSRGWCILLSTLLYFTTILPLSRKFFVCCLPRDAQGAGLSRSLKRDGVLQLLLNPSIQGDFYCEIRECFLRLFASCKG